MKSEMFIISDVNISHIQWEYIMNQNIQKSE